MGHSMKLVRIGPMGNVLALRVVENSPFFFLVRASVPRATVRVATLDWPKMTLFTIDFEFKDVAPPKMVETILLERAYELPDHSLAMFGKVEVTNLGVGDNSYTAAIARVSPRGQLEPVLAFKPRYESPWVKDAVALQVPGEFAAVRGSGRRGITMSWVSIK
jgi:hypothetical protein